jgi:proteic killer suppression protein
LRELFKAGHSRSIDKRFNERLKERLDYLDAAKAPKDLNLPGYHLHPLGRRRKGTWAISVSGPWRLTFRFDERKNEVFDVDFEQYH